MRRRMLRLLCRLGLERACRALRMLELSPALREAAVLRERQVRMHARLELLENDLAALRQGD